MSVCLSFHPDEGSSSFIVLKPNVGLSAALLCHSCAAVCVMVALMHRQEGSASGRRLEAGN